MLLNLSMKTWSDNQIELRRCFNRLHLKLGVTYKKIHIEHLAEDVCIIKRFTKNFEKAYVLVARLEYNPDAPPKSIEIELPGWFDKVKKLYVFNRKFEILEEEFPRIKANIIEQNSLHAFGSICHRSNNQRRQT